MGIFVDRDTERARMADFVQQATRSGPRVLLLRGSVGMGKSALLAAFGTQTADSLPGGRGRWVSVRCHGDVGAANAYGPIVDALTLLTPKGRRRFQLAADIATTSGLELVAGAVPAVGPALRAGVGAIRERQQDKARYDAAGVPQQLVGAVIDRVKRDKALVLAIDDAHLLDPSSCQVLDYLVSGAETYALAVLLAMRPEETSVNPALRDLVDRLTISGRIEIVTLGGLDVPSVRQFTKELTQIAIDPAQALSLTDATGGHPIFLAQYLASLRDSHTPLAAEQRIPASVELVIRQRLRHVDTETQQLLIAGATQGPRFLSVVVQEVCSQPRADVLDRLHRVATVSGPARRRGRADAESDPRNTGRTAGVPVGNCATSASGRPIPPIGSRSASRTQPVDATPAF